MYPEMPGAWVLLQIQDKYHILAGWRGGYTQGESWRRSTPVVKTVVNDGRALAVTASGTHYDLSLNEAMYCTTRLTHDIAERHEEDANQAGIFFRILTLQEAIQTLKTFEGDCNE